MKWVKDNATKPTNKEREVSLRRVFFQQSWHRLRDGLRWVWDQYAYLCEIATALFFVLGEILLMDAAINNPHALTRWDQWISTFVWAIAPTYRLPAQALPSALFWEMFLFPVGLVVFPWIAVALVRNARLEMTAWKYAPEQRIAYAIQRERTLLSFLYVVAQFENTPRHHWRQLKAANEGDIPFSPLARAPISRSAGPFSFAYVTLSTYLSLTPWAPEPQVVEESLIRTAFIPSTEPESVLPLALIPRDAKVQVLLFLFGRVRVRVLRKEGHDILIEAPRLAELLAYLGTRARNQGLHFDEIITPVYDEGTDGELVERLRFHFHNDVAEFRRFYKELLQQADLPQSDPFFVQGRGKKAQWSLSASFLLADVTLLETASGQLARAKLQTSDDGQALREIYETALQLSSEGFLEHLERVNYDGSWAKRYAKNYRAMRHQLLWDAAEYEQARGENEAPEAQRDYFRRSAQLYREYAFATLPGTASERALQHSMTIAGKIEEKSLADRNYCEYVESLKRRFPRREIDPSTTKIWKEVIEKQPGTMA